MNGLDSLYSIVQMPAGIVNVIIIIFIIIIIIINNSGIPVATVAIGNATNAGLLAIRILASSSPSLLSQMDTFMLTQEEDVLKKAAKLENIGYSAYLNPS